MRIAQFTTNSFDKVYVVFENNTSLWWLKVLKPGFRHCYLLLPFEDGNSYLELNPFSNQLSVGIRRNTGIVGYIDYLCSDSLRQVVRAQIEIAPLKCAPLGLFSCVEFAKRILGMHSRFIITPYQLYKKLKIVGKKS